MIELINVCNVDQYVSAHKCVWTDFYNWNTFLNKTFKAKLDAIKKYQLFESCFKNTGTVQCQLSGLPDSVTYNDNLLKSNMTLKAQRKVLSSKPDKLHKKPIGLRDIKEVGLKENFAKLIDNKYHKEMCPNSTLDVWIKVKNYYPLGTRIEREFI